MHLSLEVYLDFQNEEGCLQNYCTQSLLKKKLATSSSNSGNGERCPAVFQKFYWSPNSFPYNHQNLEAKAKLYLKENLLASN